MWRCIPWLSQLLSYGVGIGKLPCNSSQIISVQITKAKSIVFATCLESVDVRVEPVHEGDVRVAAVAARLPLRPAEDARVAPGFSIRTTYSFPFSKKRKLFFLFT